MTPEYLGVVWLGYSESMQEIYYNKYPTPYIWKGVMQKIVPYMNPEADFPVSPNVVQKAYCTRSGDIATDACTSTATGWYKKDNIPGNCTECYGGWSGWDDNGWGDWGNGGSSGGNDDHDIIHIG